jgi:ABC-type transport system involved in cytochrome c biogenesis permease subunit
MSTFAIGIRSAIVALAIASLGSPPASAAADDVLPPRRTAPWPKDVVDAAARIPVQHDGRIKPLDTFARFKLLQFSGKRSVKVERGDGESETLSPTEWFLDVLFFPAQASEYETFLVEDYDALSDVGMKIDGLKKRDRHSFDFLLPIGDSLVERARIYSNIEATKRSPLETEVIDVAGNLMQFADLLSITQPARVRVDVAKVYSALEPLYPGRAIVNFSDLARSLPAIHELYAEHVSSAGDSDEEKQLGFLLNTIKTQSTGWHGLQLFPAPAGEEAWLTIGELLTRCSLSTEDLEPQLELFAQLESLVPWAGDPVDLDALGKGIVAFGDRITALATARDEGAKVDLEVAYYRADFFTYSKVIFLLALLTASILWFAPRAKGIYVASSVLTVAALLVLGVGITLRCILRERPPVSTLYESILFIAFCGVLTAMIIEWVNRQRIALFLATLLGSLGLFLAGWYEEVSGTDTMPQLQAVLDTNFWLSTHVTTVTIGYAAGFLAAAIAHVYLFAKLFGFRRNQPEFYRTIGRMVYGAVCFGLVFSTIGTILGGIWANDSWGRFWGWDPKENGALMIVLMNLIILHSRLAGWVRDFGTSLLAIMLSIIVTFSWFHTNVLGVGLHSYGFDSKIASLVWSTYYVELGVIVLGIIAYALDRARGGGSAGPAATA